MSTLAKQKSQKTKSIVKSSSLDIRSVKDTANSLRDLKNWLFVFAQEYEIPQEAIIVLHAKIDEIGQKLARISCK